MQEKKEKRWESLIDHMMTADNEDVRQVMRDTKRIRALNQSPLGYTDSKVHRKLITNLPVSILRRAEKLYGKGIWMDRKFVRDFARTFPIFRGCDKI